MSSRPFAFSIALTLAGLVFSTAGMTQDTSASEMFAEWLAGYDAAFNAKDLDKLATYYHPEVTIYEGGGINDGWVDYRDHHLGPELEGFQDLEFGHRNVKAHWLSDSSAYVTAEYRLKTQYEERNIDVTGLATLIVTKSDDGTWRIRHSHTSSRRRPRKE